MKFILVILINIIFCSSLIDWMDLNQSTINSKTYKISFKKEYEVNIKSNIHHQIDKCSVVYCFNKIRYETNNSILFISPDSLVMFNKKTNQIFIDSTSEQYDFILDINLADILTDSIEIESDLYYFENSKYPAVFKMYFSNNNFNKLEVTYNDMELSLSDIELINLDSIEASYYFELDTHSYEIFDLRLK